MTGEKTYEVHWVGPYEWQKGIEKCGDQHVLYQLYGYHPLYGKDVLLYLGSSCTDIKGRLKQHEQDWVREEWEELRIRLGSIREFSAWKAQDSKPWIIGDRSLVEEIEALLIYANQPAYNDRNKSDAQCAENIRVFNTGRMGTILPEVSYKFFLGE